MIVVLLEGYQQLSKGAEGVIYDSADGGWLAVFGGVTVLLPFDGQDVIYYLV